MCLEGLNKKDAGGLTLLTPENEGNILKLSLIRFSVHPLIGCFAVERSQSFLITSDFDIVKSFHPFFDERITTAVQTGFQTILLCGLR